MQDPLNHLAKATLNYVNRISREYPAKPMRLNRRAIREIQALRHEMRVDEGGGGLCHCITEALTVKYGLGRLAVSYLAPDGTVICAGHYVNYLSDGSILDPSADQFGEGHDVRLLRPDDPEYGRIRPEFYEDFHPGLYPDELAEWLPFWKGVIDFDAQDTMNQERGRGWWVEDPSLLRAHYSERQQYALATGRQMDQKDAALMDKWIADLDLRHASAEPRIAK